jgi:hypothetical protein
VNHHDHSPWGIIVTAVYVALNALWGFVLPVRDFLSKAFASTIHALMNTGQYMEALKNLVTILNVCIAFLVILYWIRKNLSKPDRE